MAKRKLKKKRAYKGRTTKRMPVKRGKGRRTKRALKADRRKRAKKAGRRKSRTGRRYTERRRNRAD